MPVVGFLCPASPRGYATQVAAFREGLREESYREGENLAIEYRWAEDHLDQLPALAADLVKRQVDVLVVAGGTGTALAAKAASTTIPIVFAIGGDPVRAGLVASLSRPGGNLTGIAQFSELLFTKRLEVAHELVSRAAAIAVLLNPINPNLQFRLADAKTTASALGREVRILNATSQEQIDAVFASAMREQIGAIVVQDDPLFTNNGERLVALAARHAVPTIYQLREFATAGGLISYGPHIADSYRQIGIYAARILKGEKPANLPVLQPTKFELVINLKAAKALGLAIPPSLLARADEVIE